MTKNRGAKNRKAVLPPGSLVYTGKKRVPEVALSVMEYGPEGINEVEPKQISDLIRFRGGSEVKWINVIGLHDIETIEEIGAGFGIHPLVLEDILNTNHRPKIEDYGDYLYIVLKSFYDSGVDDDFEMEQISIILGRNYVISFQEHNKELFEPLRERIREGKGRIRGQGADYLAYALIDTVIDDYFDLLETIGETIEDLEDALMAGPGASTLQDIHLIKRKMLIVRKSLWPLREVIGSLERGESKLMKDSTLIYIRDVYDHTIQAIDTLETYRDILSGMLDIYLSSISNRMNQIVKVLTIISTIFMPLTFIVGVYGMNFRNMPEIESPWGYPSVWAVMIIISMAMVAFFWKRRWL